MQYRKIHLGRAWVGLEFDPSFEDLISFLFPQETKPEDLPQECIQAACYVLKMQGADGGVALERNGNYLLQAPSIETAASSLLDRVCYDLVDACRDGLVLHAALVAKNGRGLILPAVSGNGKSTMAAWLVQHGFDYGSDELVYTPSGINILIPFPRPINLKQRARSRTNAIFGFSESRYRDNVGWLASPPVDFFASQVFGPGKISGPVTPYAVVFPKFYEQADLLYQPLSKGRAGLGWMQHLLNARNLPQHGFSEISRLARTIPAYLLEYGSIDSLGDIFNSLITD